MRAQEKQILLLRWGGIGDTLVIFPSVYFLRSHFSGYFFRMICRQDVGSIFTLAGLIDQVISPDDARVGELFIKGREKVFLAAEKYFLIIGWFNHCPQLETFPGSSIIYEPQCGLPINQYFFLQTLRIVKGAVFQRKKCFEEFTRLPLSSEWLAEAEKWLPGDIFLGKKKAFGLICPGSGGREKCWPWESYFNLIEELAQEGIQGLVVTGPAEEDLWSGLKKNILPPGWFICHCPPLWVVAAWMKMARFYVGNDSGLTHLAALVGVPGVALFLKKNLPVWKPGGKLRVLAQTRLNRIPLFQVKKMLIESGALS